jgi:hypothetical protein
MIRYIVPMDAFVHTDSTAQVTLTAQMIDGTALPSWLIFDSEKGEFKGIPPTDFVGELVIKVTARDQEGRQAETILRIRVGMSADKLTLRGKPSFAAQLAADNTKWKVGRENQHGERVAIRLGSGRSA